MELHISVQKYFGMAWREQWYVWKVLPFGCAASPYVFKKILEPVTAYLREQDLRIALFVDDFLQMARPSITTDHVDKLLSTLDELGWSVNNENAHLVPSIKCDFIGFTIYSEGPQGPWMQVMPHKVRKLRCLLRQVLRNSCISAKLLARVTGQCVAMTKAILPGKLLLRNVYRLLSTKENWHSQLVIDKPSKDDLNWWLQSLANWNGGPLIQKAVDIQFESDASPFGWGCCIRSSELIVKGSEALGTWSPEIAFMHSNFRELYTVLLGVQSF